MKNKILSVLMLASWTLFLTANEELPKQVQEQSVSQQEESQQKTEKKDGQVVEAPEENVKKSRVKLDKDVYSVLSIVWWLTLGNLSQVFLTNGCVKVCSGSICAMQMCYHTTKIIDRWFYRLLN